MASRLLAVFASVFLAVVVCGAALSSELYWNHMLLGIPMPHAVKELLQPGNLPKTMNDGYHYDGKQPDALPFFYRSYGKHPDQQPDALPFFYRSYGKRSNLSQPDPNPNDGKQPDRRAVDNHVSSKDKVRDHDNGFFLERDLIPGRKINVNLKTTTMWSSFLSRQRAEAIPFSTDKVTQVMEMFSISPQSPEAKVFKETIKRCEDAPQDGEEKHCATSLESMVDFVVYKLGRNVQSLSTEIGMSRQQYTSVEKVGGSNSIVCHSQAYMYPIFHCHATQSTKVYKLPLDTKGNKNAVMAVCHMDTSKWDPEHIAFEVLKVKPGTTPVCHFLPEGHLVWTSDETST